MIDAYELLTRRSHANDGVARRDSMPSPIEALRGLRAALSDALRSGTGKGRGDAASTRRSGPGASGNEQPAGEERRKEARRKANMPIVLDTRSSQRREEDRSNASSPAINVEI
jgi:hypothetical protein